jgi:hypothetical protein
MAKLGRTEPGSAVTLVTTPSLNSLPNGSSADVVVDLNDYRSEGVGNGLYKLHAHFGLVLGSFTPTTLYVPLYCLPAVEDGTPPTLFADEADATNLVTNFPLTSGASSKNLFFGGLPLWKYNRYVKFRVKNITGVSLASSGNTLRAWFHTGDESL